MQLHIEYPNAGGNVWSFWNSYTHRHLWLRLFGPGRVAVQSAYEKMEDNGRNVWSHSGASEKSW
jgi:hypothetical protein